MDEKKMVARGGLSPWNYPKFRTTDLRVSQSLSRALITYEPCGISGFQYRLKESIWKSPDYPIAL